jgi:Rab GDP dissociation inhibitor
MVELLCWMQPVDEILTNENGIAWGIRCEQQIGKSSMLIGDPSYFPRSKLRDIGVQIDLIMFLLYMNQ